MISEAPIRLDANSFTEAASTLINAFAGDRIFERLKLSPKMVRRMYEIPLKIGFRYGEVYSISERCEGVMVFCSDEWASVNLGHMAKSGAFFSSIGLLKILANKHMRKLFVTLEEDKKKLDIGPFLYLMVIGVLPESQSMGYGGRLLDFLCERADREGKALYLETQNKKNVTWYEKFGFQVIKEISFADWLPLWEMVRSRT